jgi:hypothetical protein
MKAERFLSTFKYICVPLPPFPWMPQHAVCMPLQYPRTASDLEALAEVAQTARGTSPSLLPSPPVVQTDPPTQTGQYLSLSPSLESMLPRMHYTTDHSCCSYRGPA